MNNQQVAEAFCRHEFAAVYPHLADDVRWELVGQNVIVGKQAVMAHCAESAAYLAGVATSFSQLTSLAAADRVVVESRAAYTDGDGSVSRVASCDLFTFGGGRVTEIISYSVAINES